MWIVVNVYTYSISSFVKYMTDMYVKKYVRALFSNFTKKIFLKNSATIYVKGIFLFIRQYVKIREYCMFIKKCIKIMCIKHNKCVRMCIMYTLEL